jgi:pimeloyl-ACP methyl ester carboxylesterase
MAASVSHTLEVPGATLHFERRGSGPMLLLIAGGNGDAGPFEPLAQALGGQYEVVSYDRRGFSRSTLHEPLALADGAQRLATDCEDARRLIEHVGGGTAHVFGSSSGAIAALHLLLRHPQRVRSLVAHEPPLIDLLPDAAEHVRLFAAVYGTYRESGVEAAMRQFLTAIGLPMRPPPAGELPAELRAQFERMRQNQAYWLEHELRQYPRLTPDLAALQPYAARFVLGVGQDSRGTLPYRSSPVLAERLGISVSEFAGGHIGYVTHPLEFAAGLQRVLS